MNPNKNCIKCNELVKSRKMYDFGVPTWGTGNNLAEIMFIGEAPGMYGCGRTGIPFSGDRSGNFFRECLQEVDLKAEDVYITNIVKCCPERNRTPEEDEVTNCLPYLLDEIKAIRPMFVIPLGRPATNLFFRFDVSMHSVSWSFYDITFKGSKFTVVPFYHPAWALRVGKMDFYKRMFKSSVDLIKEQIEEKKAEESKHSLGRFVQK